jgi:anti-sigma B factor antagonist
MQFSTEMTTRVHDDVVIVDLTASVSLCGTAELPQLVTAHLQQGHLRFLINCGRLSHIDSSGLAGLTRACVTVNRQNGAFKLYNVSPRIRELFRVTKLSAIFEVFDTEDEALRSFSTAAARRGGVRFQAP